MTFRFFAAITLVLVSGGFCTAQEFLVKLPYNSTHYIIDDNVNVRSEPSLNGQKRFKLNTGDKVVIQSKSLAYIAYNWDRDEFEKLKTEEKFK